MSSRRRPALLFQSQQQSCHSQGRRCDLPRGPLVGPDVVEVIEFLASMIYETRELLHDLRVFVCEIVHGDRVCVSHLRQIALNLDRLGPAAGTGATGGSASAFVLAVLKCTTTAVTSCSAMSRGIIQSRSLEFIFKEMRQSVAHKCCANFWRHYEIS